MKRLRIGVVVLGMVVCVVPSVPAAAAAWEGTATEAAAGVVATNVPLQPGAPLVNQGGMWANTLCTLNFVFQDKSQTYPGTTKLKTYIGTSGHCTLAGVGQRAKSPEIGTFGTVVFRVFNDPIGTSNDFALIAVDRDKLKHVSPVMRGYGAAPSGYTTSNQTNTGDPLVTHGWPSGWPAGVSSGAVTRYGALALDYPTHFLSAKPMVLDSGAPVVRVLDGKAVGISQEIGISLSGMTVEHIFVLLRQAGFNVTLRLSSVARLASQA